MAGVVVHLKSGYKFLVPDATNHEEVYQKLTSKGLDVDYTEDAEEDDFIYTDIFGLYNEYTEEEEDTEVYES